MLDALRGGDHSGVENFRFGVFFEQFLGFSMRPSMPLHFFPWVKFRGLQRFDRGVPHVPWFVPDALESARSSSDAAASAILGSAFHKLVFRAVKVLEFFDVKILQCI